MLDPRLTDLEVARLVADLREQRRGQVPAPMAGVETARLRTQRDRTPDDEQVHTVDLTIGGPGGPLPLRVYVPQEPIDVVVVFAHGGGWVLGDLEMNDALVRDLTARSQAVTVSVDYRLAPEHPYPAAVDDMVAALSWVWEGGVSRFTPSRRIAVAGHSAGGNLAAAAAVRSAGGEAPPLVHQVLLCPVLDHDLGRDSYVRNGHDSLLTTEEMRWYWDLYAPDVALRDAWDLSPLRIGDASGLAPATIVVAGADPLRDEGVLFAELLSGAGVDAELYEQQGVPHLYLTFPPVAAREASVDFVAAAVQGLA